MEDAVIRDGGSWIRLETLVLLAPTLSLCLSTNAAYSQMLPHQISEYEANREKTGFVVEAGATRQPAWSR